MLGRVEPQRTHDELTATHADTHQEEDGGVHVDVLEIEAYHADRVTKGPGVGEVVVDPQRQREHLRRAEGVKIVAEEELKQHVDDTFDLTPTEPWNAFLKSFSKVSNYFFIPGRYISLGVIW